MTDRGFWVGSASSRLNVRRLMYQSLIWSRILTNDPRRLRTAFNLEDSQGLADPLIDGVGGNAELGSNFLGAEMLVDEAETIELAGSQSCDAPGDRIFRHLVKRPPIFVRQTVRVLQHNPHPATHRHYRAASLATLRSFVNISPEFQRLSAKLAEQAST
jgi:hypothetical protein